MNRSLLAAPAAALLLCGLLAGTAMAQEEDPPRTCEVVESELAAAQVAAQLPVTIDGVTYPNLGAVQTALAGLPAGVEAVEPLVTKLQAIVDAAAKVDLLKTEQTTCVDGAEPTTPPTTDVPPATDAPGTDDPAPSDPTTTFTVIPDPQVSQSPNDRPNTADSIPQGPIDTGWA